MTSADIAHETRLFLVDGAGGVHALDQHRYAALARGETHAPELAGQRFVLVDWYLRLVGGRPEAAVSETCSWIVFDERGAVDLHAALVIDAEAAPTEAQWARIRELAFGPAASTARPK
ncbi:MAG: hypothetical protein U5L03_12560 [Burkholderiaceae bacterium]|nr:hypothetical protein [Burkholderiaceae bacterium]